MDNMEEMGKFLEKYNLLRLPRLCLIVEVRVDTLVLLLILEEMFLDF